MRLIDADKLKISYDGHFVGVAKNDLDNAPTVEVEPIVHAHWVTMSDADGLYYCCSNCGEDLPRYYTERPTWDNPFPNMESIDKTPRCPYCGAKMNEEVEEDNDG